MTNKPVIRTLLILVLGVLCTFAWRREGEARNNPPAGPGAEMSRAATAFLDSLEDDQKKKALFKMKDEERINWHYIPRKRNGLPFKEMTESQVKLAKALVASGLSDSGYKTALEVVALEQVLFELEGKAHRDKTLYYVSIFGKPSVKGAWGWRFEGHHLSVNVTVAGPDTLSIAPSFYGANPHAYKGNRPLGTEEDIGRTFVSSLNEKQREVAIISGKSPREIMTKAVKRVKLKSTEGIPFPRLSEEQRKALRSLVKTYVDKHRSEAATLTLDRIEEVGWNKVHFAWAGPIKKGKAQYYRVQGPTFLIEYVNSQNKANHSHSVYRDLENDFGEDLLRLHYEKNPH